MYLYIIYWQKEIIFNFAQSCIPSRDKKVVNFKKIIKNTHPFCYVLEPVSSKNRDQVFKYG